MAKTQLVPFLALMVALLFVAGCAQLILPGLNITQDEGPTAAVSTDIEKTTEELAVMDEAEELAESPEEETEQPEATETISAAPADSLPRKVVVEGSLVSFPNLQATDPDGDKIAYTFTPPLDTVGKWQTKVGDAGEYRVTITASDGKNSVSQVVVIEVKPKNQPPRIQLASKELKVKEGQIVTINAQASDPDGDKVTLSFDGWMNGPTRTTDFTDAGVHEVEIIASDGKATAREKVSIVVENVNRAPAINKIEDVIIKEGDRITVNPTATDPDGDRITYTFSAPLSPDGTWGTEKKDVGKYRINVTASDGAATATTNFLIVVESLNSPPTIQLADLITADEGQTVTLSPAITDPEGDELTITYSGWMNSNTYTTTYEDSGSHLVTLTVSDGINTVKKDVTVMVNDVNRPPSFGSGAFS